VWDWVSIRLAATPQSLHHWPPPACELAAMLDALLWQWDGTLTPTTAGLTTPGGGP